MNMAWCSAIKAYLNSSRQQRNPRLFLKCHAPSEAAYCPRVTAGILLGLWADLLLFPGKAALGCASTSRFHSPSIWALIPQIAGRFGHTVAMLGHQPDRLSAWIFLAIVALFLCRGGQHLLSLSMHHLIGEVRFH